MAEYTGKITSVIKINNTIRIEGKLYRDAEEFAMPPLSVPADTATVASVTALVQDEILKLRQGYEAETTLQGIIGDVIELTGVGP